MLNEYVIDMRVPAIEEWVPHRSCVIPYDANGLKMALVRIMTKSDGHVPHIVQRSVERAVRCQHGGLHHVTKNINATSLVQSLSRTVRLHKQTYIFVYLLSYNHILEFLVLLIS